MIEHIGGAKKGRQCKVNIPEKDEARVSKRWGQCLPHFRASKKILEWLPHSIESSWYKNTFCENAFYPHYRFNPEEKSTKGAEQNVVTQSAVSRWALVNDDQTGNGTPADKFDEVRTGYASCFRKYYNTDCTDWRGALANPEFEIRVWMYS